MLKFSSALHTTVPMFSELMFLCFPSSLSGISFNYITLYSKTHILPPELRVFYILGEDNQLLDFFKYARDKGGWHMPVSPSIWEMD